MKQEKVEIGDIVQTRKKESLVTGTRESQTPKKTPCGPLGMRRNQVLGISKTVDQRLIEEDSSNTLS